MVHGVNVIQMQMSNICVSIVSMPKDERYTVVCVCVCVHVACKNEYDQLSFCFLCHPSTECMSIVWYVLNVYACESWSDFVVTNDLLFACNAGFSAYIRTNTIWPDLGFDSYFRFKCCGWMLRMCVYVILSVWVKQRIYICVYSMGHAVVVCYCICEIEALDVIRALKLFYSA